MVSQEDEDVDRNMFFKLKESSRTRGHKAALVKEQCRLDMRKYSFSQRVINEWNKLPNDCVNDSSVNMFKNRIDRYLIMASFPWSFPSDFAVLSSSLWSNLGTHISLVPRRCSPPLSLCLLVMIVVRTKVQILVSTSSDTHPAFII